MAMVIHNEGEETHQMTKLMFACMTAFALTACPHKHEGGGEALSKMTELKDKMCACKTPACATALTDEQIKWAQAMGKTLEPQKLSEEETKKLTAVGQDFAKCLAEATKVAEPVAPTPPAPTETGSAGSAGSAAK